MLKTKLTLLLIAGLTVLFPFNNYSQVLGTGSDGKVYEVKDFVMVRMTFLLSDAGRPYDFQILEISPAEVIPQVDSKAVLARASNLLLAMDQREVAKWELDPKVNRYLGSIAISRESLGLN